MFQARAFKLQTCSILSPQTRRLERFYQKFHTSAKEIIISSRGCDLKRKFGCFGLPHLSWRRSSQRLGTPAEIRRIMAW